MRATLFILLLAFSSIINAQTNTPSDPEATALLQKLSTKFKAFKTISADFTLTINHPKPKPEDSDAKYTETLTGKVDLKGAKFKINIKGQEIRSDGKTICTYIPTDKEVQINDYEENQEIFSPSKIFTFYTEGYSYRVKEKKTVNNRKLVIIEMIPVNKKVSFFKIDVTIDEAALTIVESKIYDKSGTRYTYIINKLTTDVAIADDIFVCSCDKFPGAKCNDLR
jgi:outer membrane lipoprotein carrier protein